jgi:hypothetical protein
MFVHEYSDEEFESYEDCREDLMSWVDSDDIVQHFEYSTSTLIFKFLNRKNDKEFLQWLAQEIDETYERTLDELITEYEEGEVE